MKYLNILFAMFLVIALTSCGDKDKKGDTTKTADGTENSTNINEATETDAAEMVIMDLSEKSVPITINVPTGAEISEGMMNGDFGGVNLVNYEISKDGWILDISMMDETPYQEISEYIQDAKDLATETEGFKEITEEVENGFIYKLTNEDGDEYNLYYVIFKNDRAIEIEEGLKFSNFSLEEIKSMFAAAQTAI